LKQRYLWGGNKMASMPFYYQKFCLWQNFIDVGNSGLHAAGVRKDLTKIWKGVLV
jgi:hypothetical protein